MKHTKENCFKIHGYLYWWHELKAKKKHEAGHAVIANIEMTHTEPHISLIPQEESSTAIGNCLLAQNEPGNQG